MRLGHKLSFTWDMLTHFGYGRHLAVALAPLAAVPSHDYNACSILFRSKEEGGIA